MTARPAFRQGTLRHLAASVSCSAAALAMVSGGWASPASASPAADATPATPASAGPSSTPPGTGADGGSSSLPGLQVQAQELAGEIEADGRALDELAGQDQGAQLRYQELAGQQAALQAQEAVTAAAVDQARAALKEQALLAYLAGGAPLISYVPDRPGQDPSLTSSYAEIVTGGEKRAVDDYRATLAAESAQQTAVQANMQQQAVALQTVRSDEAQADATLQSRQHALSQVQGQMAVLVAQVQAQQQEAAASTLGAGLNSGSQAADGAASASPSASPSSSPSTSAPTISAPRPAAPAGSGPSGGVPATSAVTRATPAGSTAPPTTAPGSTDHRGSSGSSSSSGTPAGSGASRSGGSGPTSAPTGPAPAQAPGADRTLSYARAQLGKPYQWGGAGPDSFDCSGLVMMAWEQAGIDFPHLAQAQYDRTARIALSTAQPGDLIFFGTPDNVYHVGIYIGNGQMIDAPETGQDVSVQSIYWDSLLGAGRVHS